jgi:hypothetical protein
MSQKVRRAIRFIQSCIRLRSISLARWIDDYDNYNEKSRP